MSTPYRMVARSFGGPEVIARESFDPGQPGEGEVLVENEAIGLNFIDVYYRTGLYDAPLPVARETQDVPAPTAMPVASPTSGLSNNTPTSAPNRPPRRRR